MVDDQYRQEAREEGADILVGQDGDWTTSGSETRSGGVICEKSGK